MTLTPAQRRCLQAMADGLTQREYARQAHYHPATVKLHLRRAREALGARTTAQAVAMAVDTRQIKAPRREAA